MSKKIKPYVIFISLLFSLSYVTASELNPQHTITSDNKQLSLQRAFSVKHFLLSQGLPEDKIIISAFTHKKTETNAHEQEKNRSVIIDFVFSN